ncbi:hypothetical protein [Sphingomonas jatrophae]|uniref:Uncharacterized protein n=1 Tax=Sphingomonas jatrophae TaxID=1166337 RepID=A0A1I6JM29_9SPHN|nr:hypothetical protein [Sphingomonas jatrophae]SFR79987.1 hypothetical protein SAMN05192580_0505 [Sphingomonas jatrophae]
MSERDRFVAVSLLTQRDLDRWGNSLRNVYPLGNPDDFSELLRRIDAADADHRSAGSTGSDRQN